MIRAIHDTVLNNYIQGDVRVLSEGERIFLIGQHRSKYIIPFWQEQKEIPSQEGLRAMGTIDPHKVFKNTTYMLVDIDGNFQGISKECMSSLMSAMMGVA